MQEPNFSNPNPSEVLVLGAGPGGLTAAYALLKQGVDVTIVEKQPFVGGLMRAVKHENFSVDLGYKHLYSRIPEVQALWEELLGDDFLPYQPRTGILYNGHILERERSFKGLRRGMPYGLMLSAFADLLKYNLFHRYDAIASLQDYTYARRGRKFTKIFSQEFDERFKGIKWADLPAPQTMERRGLWHRFLNDATKSLQKQEKWYHPAKGTGQIIERLEEEIRKMGGKFYLNCAVRQISHHSGVVHSVIADHDGQMRSWSPNTLISSLPLQFLAPLMDVEIAPQPKELSFRRGVIMVYLFLDCQIKFPHTSLHVSCPATLISRITNYGAISGKMVPEGQGCLCIEYFIHSAVDLLAKTDHEIFDLALTECEKSGLLQRADCKEFKVIRGASDDPATSWEDYVNDPSRKAFYDRLAGFQNLYQINRTGTDKSTYAGLMAAKAILEGNKAVFDHSARPDVKAPWEVKGDLVWPA